MEDRQTPRRTGQGDVEPPETLLRLVHNRRRLDDDRPVELEAVRQVDRKQAHRGPEAVPLGIS